MKRILLACVVGFTCLNALASPYNKDYEEHACSSLMSLAGSAMSARQYGIPMSKPLESMYEVTSSPAEEFVNQKMYDMIVSAYSANIYKTEKAKSVAISGFSAKYYLECADDFGL